MAEQADETREEEVVSEDRDGLGEFKSHIEDLDDGFSGWFGLGLVACMLLVFCLVWWKMGPTIMGTS